MENLAEVRLWGRLVGALAYEPNRGVSTFEFAPQWRKTGIDIAPLHVTNSRH